MATPQNTKQYKLLDRSTFIKLIKESHYGIPDTMDIKDDSQIIAYIQRKVTRLYTSNIEFRNFLDSKTSFIAKATLSHFPLTGGRVNQILYRWFHYRDGRTEQKSCPVCSKPLLSYDKTYCCHECSTKESLGSKRGPKVDLAMKEKELRAQLRVKQPNYKLVKFDVSRGHHNYDIVSTFRHKCGQTFDADNGRLLRGRHKCPCTHGKLKLHDLDTLVQSFKGNKSNWIPKEYKPEDGVYECVLCANRKCGHTQWLRKDGYKRRCFTCNPDKFTHNKLDNATYVKELKAILPDFKPLTPYVDSRLKLTFYHTVCRKEFESLPYDIKRKGFLCPVCYPRMATGGTYKEYVVGNRTIRVRGFEDVALDWILKNTNVKLEDIELDSEGTIPLVRYKTVGEPRTRRYHPDFYIRKSNILVEVKGLSTLGVAREFFYADPKTLWLTNCAKAKACIAAGFKFNLMVFHGHTRINLPKDWYTYSHRKIIQWLKQNGHI